MGIKRRNIFTWRGAKSPQLPERSGDGVDTLSSAKIVIEKITMHTIITCSPFRVAIHYIILYTNPYTLYSVYKDEISQTNVLVLK